MAAERLGPELIAIVSGGDPDRVGLTANRIASLFAEGASAFQAQHVTLFDDVLTTLLPRTTGAARADLAERLAGFDNAPPLLMGHLAKDGNIDVAGPVLSRFGAIDERALTEIARSHGQRSSSVRGTPACILSMLACE